MKDWLQFEQDIRCMIVLEILHNIGSISDTLYYQLYSDNAEILERDIEIWSELQ